LGNFGTAKIDNQNMRLFQGINRRTGLESDRGQTSKTMLSRDGHNWKIRNREQRTDVGKYPYVNTTIKSWNQQPAGLQTYEHILRVTLWLTQEVYVLPSPFWKCESKHGAVVTLTTIRVEQQMERGSLP
jgi:hypothetical protein